MPSKRSDEDSKRLCGDCSLCCTYVTIEVHEPKSHDDIDHLIWLVHHKGVSIFIDPDGWYVQFQTPCNHFSGKCDIYTERPQICRDYAHEECEHYGKDDIYFRLKDKKAILDHIKKHNPLLWKEYAENGN